MSGDRKINWSTVGVVSSLVLSVAAIAYYAGVVSGNIGDLERRIGAIETKPDESVGRIGRVEEATAKAVLDLRKEIDGRLERLADDFEEAITALKASVSALRDNVLRCCHLSPTTIPPVYMPGHGSQRLFPQQVPVVQPVGGAP